MIDREIAALLSAAEYYAEKKRVLDEWIGDRAYQSYLVDEAEKAFRDAFRAAVGAVIAEGPP